MASLSRDDVEHVALLARLGLGDEEIGRLRSQLNHVLDQYAKLTELDTDAIAPTAQTIEVENVLRDDEPRPSLPAWAVVDNAPETRDGRLVVPAIIGGD
jgi:aspartyl-tRNA(Asn)/glutamyl-tRNA(Gln) amidotransferase subunit C